MRAIVRGWEDAKDGKPCPYKVGTWSLAPFWRIGARYFAEGKDAAGARYFAEGKDAAGAPQVSR
jgi:hypothetical protein